MMPGDNIGKYSSASEKAVYDIKDPQITDVANVGRATVFHQLQSRFYETNGSAGSPGKKTRPVIALKVAAGDKVGIYGKSCCNLPPVREFRIICHFILQLSPVEERSNERRRKSERYKNV